jgi:putative membrane protein
MFAHGVVSASLGRWTFEPITVAWLVASVVLYGLGVRNLWRRAGAGMGIGRWQAASFAAANAAVAIALLSPLAWLSEILFSAHMTQHEVLMVVAAPLFAMSKPLVAFLWAFEPPFRVAMSRSVRGPAFRAFWQALSAPFTVFALHAGALWVWHMPRLYEWALVHQGVHAVQHSMFLATAALFWWGMVHGRYGRAGYGVAVFYVFLTAVHSSILGALATVADRLWYPHYAARAAEWHLNPLVDQQLAGLIMWVPSGLTFIVLGLALLAAWLGESERRTMLSRTEPVR